MAFLAGGFSLLGFANPDCACACSCIQSTPIAEYANEHDTLILAIPWIAVIAGGAIVAVIAIAAAASFVSGRRGA